MTHTIYLLEDEQHLNEVLTAYLIKEGWSVSSFLTVEEASMQLHTTPHLWILDIMLPDGSGYDFIKDIKAIQPNVPVIFISARDQSFDRLLGLELGSDDYLPKPFLPKELVIRSKKILERVYKHETKESLTVYQFSCYEIVVENRTIKKEEDVIELTSREFDLVLTFVKYKNRVFSRADLLNDIWGQNYFGSDRVVDDLVRRIRKKLPKLRIETIYGYGYRLSC